MLELGSKIGRQRAHDAIYEAGQASRHPGAAVTAETAGRRRT